jgi:hypothetical protein
MAGDFKSSPVFVAGSTAAATIALAVLIYKEVLLPTHTLALQNQITALTTESAAYKARIEPLEKTNDSLNEQAGLLRAKVRELEAANLFSAGNPYPIGFGAVRIGQPISDVEKTFPAEQINKERIAYWSVTTDHALISSATYYFSGDKKVIHQVLFILRSGKTNSLEDAEFLEHRALILQRILLS